MPGTKVTTTGVFHILNMSCSTCARAITKRLENLDGVAKVGINYITDEARVDYDPATVSPETIRKTIEKAGYKTFEKGRMAV